MRSILGLCLLLACTFAQAQPQGIRIETLEQAAPGLSDQPIRVRIYLPPDYASTQARYETLYVNDGQDMEAVGMQATLGRLYARYAIRRIIVVAVDMPPDRMGGYGLFDRARGEAIVAPTRYGAVGANAQAYAAWFTKLLVPAIDARYRTRAEADGRAFLGWSLGALSAFGIGWQYPELFGRVGAFSPSFWLSAENGNPDAVQRTRIVHAMVDTRALMPRPGLFFGVGTQEETDDRDGDGIIDVLDDTRDLVEGWVMEGRSRRGLRARGDGTHPDDVALFQLEGGQHDQPSWARMLPAFLQWAYPAQAIARPVH